MTDFAPHETGTLEGDSGTHTRGAYMMSDMEARFGLDERSDLEIRAPGMSGVVLSYKRLLTSSNLRVIPSVTVHGWELVRILTVVF